MAYPVCPMCWYTEYVVDLREGVPALQKECCGCGPQDSSVCSRSWVGGSGIRSGSCRTGRCRTLSGSTRAGSASSEAGPGRFSTGSGRTSGLGSQFLDLGSSSLISLFCCSSGGSDVSCHGRSSGALRQLLSPGPGCDCGSPAHLPVAWLGGGLAAGPAAAVLPAA